MKRIGKRRDELHEKGDGSMIQASFRIVAPEDKRREILDVLLCLKGPTEVATGCRACRILQDVEDDHVLTYLVQWDTHGRDRRPPAFGALPKAPSLY